MKKIRPVLLAALMLFCLCIPAFADPVSSYDLFTGWETNGYPEDVTGVFYNTETQNLSIILKGNTAEQQAKLNEQLSDAASVTYFTGKYSHSELETVRAAIADEMASDSGISGVGVGWSVVSGGFGESGKDFRVVVDATDDAAEALAAKYAEVYGDMVAVDSVGSIVAAQQDAAQNTTADGAAQDTPQGGLSNWGIIGIVAICLAGLVFGVNRFMKNRHRKDENIQL